MEMTLCFFFCISYGLFQTALI